MPLIHYCISLRCWKTRGRERQTSSNWMLTHTCTERAVDWGLFVWSVIDRRMRQRLDLYVLENLTVYSQATLSFHIREFCLTSSVHAYFLFYLWRIKHRDVLKKLSLLSRYTWKMSWRLLLDVHSGIPPPGSWSQMEIILNIYPLVCCCSFFPRFISLDL